MALFTLGANGLGSGVGGSLILLSSVTASNDASIIFDSSLITDTYDTYKVIGENLKFSTDDVRAEFHLSTDNGSNYTTSNYLHNTLSGSTNDSNNATIFRASTNTTGFRIFGVRYNQGNATNEKTNFEATLFSLRDTASYKFMSLKSAYATNSNYIGMDNGVYALKSITTAVNNLKFSASSGNITSGRILLYGVKN